MSGIVIAPFSNSGIRNWPGGHFAALVSLLLDGPAGDRPIHVVGMTSQKLQACEIVRAFPADRVFNQCGRQNWTEMVAMLKSARCIVANNSGVGHLGGFFGVPTVSVFAGTHSRHEWRALGSSVTIVSRAIGCSPCQLDHGQISPYDKACLRQIEPAIVADAILQAMARGTRRHVPANEARTVLQEIAG